MTEEDFLYNLKILIDYASSRGIIINMKSSINAQYPEENLICVCSRIKSYEEKILVLLHELGHTIYSYKANTPFTAVPYGTQGRSPTKDQMIMTILDQEINAWNYGHTLIARFNLRVDEESFRLYKAKYISMYVNTLGNSTKKQIKYMYSNYVA